MQYHGKDLKYFCLFVAIIILIVIISQKQFFAVFLLLSTHVSAFHNFSELNCVFFLFMIVGINSNSCRKWKVHERKTSKRKNRNWMGERNRRERKYGVSYTVLWLLQTESTRKTVRDSQLLTWREKVYLHGLSILCWYWAILKLHEYYNIHC